MSRGQQVIEEINLIRSVLVNQGNRIQKLPRQAICVIRHSNGKSYRLTYQPVPINAWSLHPPDRDASQLLGVIDRALRNLAIANDGRKA